MTERYYSDEERGIPTAEHCSVCRRALPFPDDGDRYRCRGTDLDGCGALLCGWCCEEGEGYCVSCRRERAGLDWDAGEDDIRRDPAIRR